MSVSREFCMWMRLKLVLRCLCLLRNRFILFWLGMEWLLGMERLGLLLDVLEMQCTKNHFLLNFRRLFNINVKSGIKVDL